MLRYNIKKLAPRFKQKCMTRIIVAILLLGLIQNCKQNKPALKPKDLTESISYFEEKWTDKQKDDFIKDSLKNAHFTVGLWIRNNWVYGKRDTNLVKYFNSLGIYHPDNISSIILNSLYRKLTNKPIELEKQVEDIKAAWTVVSECKKKQVDIAVNNYKKIKVGERISIYMPVDTSEGERNAVTYVCPYTKWNFNPNVDLKITGIVKEKYFINDSSNVFFKILILKMNYPNTMVLSENIERNHTFDFSLTGLTIKKYKPIDNESMKYKTTCSGEALD
jgi:hypothetical protein